MTKNLDEILKGRPKILVDREYFYIIQKESELLEILKDHGVEDWDGYDDAEQEYNDELIGDDN